MTFRPLIIYALCFIALSLFIHSSIIFNGYNYGRHWDWSFYSTPSQYEHYVRRFFSSINENSLGYYDVLSTGLSEFFVKSGILILYKILTQIGVPITIPVLNKLTVFVFFSFISSIGIWFLTKNIYKANKKLFYFIVSYLNLIFSFSLVVLFDLHGGALNRQISTILFPWFFLFVYEYITRESQKQRLLALLKCVVVVAFFDVSNIFFAGVVFFCAIAITKQTLWKKCQLGLIFAFGVLLVNFYWLHSFFIPSTNTLNVVLSERRFDFQALAGYSSTFLQTLTFTNTPQNLIQKTFAQNLVIYIPFLTLFFLTLLNFLRAKKINALIFFSFFIFLFSTILVGGVYGFASVYEFMYQLPFFGFIRGAVRFAPNASLVIVFIFLCSLEYTDKTKLNGLQYIVMGLGFASWFLFLGSHRNLFEIITKQVTNDDVNNSTGALYTYDPTIENFINNDDSTYYVLHQPSWLSPIFTQNVFPKTSQGSITENNFRTGILYTFIFTQNGNSVIQSFSRSKDLNGLYSIANIKYVWENSETKAYKPIERAAFVGRRNYNKSQIKEVPKGAFLPRIYIPTQVNTTNIPLAYAYTALEDITATHSAAVLFEQQNEHNIQDFEFNKVLDNRPVVEFKKFNANEYRVKVSQAQSSFPLVLSSSYHREWVAKITEPSPTTRIFEPSEWIANSVENNSLPNIKWSDRFSQLNEVPTDHHVLLNGYANGWIVNPSKLCKVSAKCQETENGYDFDLLIVFRPQYFFVFSLAISITTLIVLISYLTFVQFKSHLHDK
jgi:hypothetical protein